MLKKLFEELAGVFDGDLLIERQAADALRKSADSAPTIEGSATLAKPFLDVIAEPDAHPVCSLIEQIPFQWSPPQTSSDPLYVQHSLAKAHVELLGPTGLVKSDTIRLGLYGMLPHAEYGIRTHPAEEIYLMLAGRVDWKRADDPYIEHVPNQRSYHPSTMEHANRTGDKAFLSVYVWHGDISTKEYNYSGVPVS